MVWVKTGNIKGPQGPQGDPGPLGPAGPPGTGLFRTGHTWAVDGTVIAGALPRLFVPLAPQQTVRLVSVRAMAATGAVGVQMQLDGANVGGVINVGTAPADTAFSTTIGDGSGLGATLVDQGGATDLTVTAVLEHTIGG